MKPTLYTIRTRMMVRLLCCAMKNRVSNFGTEAKQRQQKTKQKLNSHIINITLILLYYYYLYYYLQDKKVYGAADSKQHNR